MNSDSTIPALGSNGSPATWRVLLAASCRVEQKLAAGLLTRQGHQVLVASTSADAIQEMSDHDVDVLVIDGTLPEDPTELIGTVRKHEQAHQHRVAVLWMTDEGEEALPAAVAAGADAVVSKPLNATAFTTCVSNIVNQDANQQRCAELKQAVDDDPVDWSAALEAVDGQRSLLMELVSIFMTEYPLTLHDIRHALEQGDAKGLHISAHRLKGCLRYFGWTKAGCLARDLEEMGKKGQLADAESHWQQLNSALDSLIPKLRAGPA